MNTYIADGLIDGLVIQVQFEAHSWRRAENIARKHGWTIVSELIDGDDCPLDVRAMIEKTVKNPTVH